MSHFEIEVKSLLGEKERADALKQKMQELDPACACVSTNKQLNHYFEGGDIKQLFEKVQHLFTGEQLEKFETIAERGSDCSVRTRQRDNEVLLVVKASIDGGTSSNSIQRMEFEEPVSITLDELDALVQEAGYVYQAKWSREREEYAYKGANVCIDRNAGYGYLAEFEKIVPDAGEADAVRSELDSLMAELEVEELSQNRLARMFDFYNQNWPDYYGTDKTFIVE
ncbi:MAG: CYTH domain-containing protein [Candidatus Kaiserbacteria bacterium]|nr:CYTH domain-containing protein [Candidatus Kaiserbacteria bacterium]MCB9816387.1 CYTH domain-containing protein [Candidatus Nomurabacteria bacterium]